MSAIVRLLVFTHRVADPYGPRLPPGPLALVAYGSQKLAGHLPSAAWRIRLSRGRASRKEAGRVLVSCLLGINCSLQLIF
jgi:hypothetical protein